MKLPTYNGWPIVANFSPIEGKWCLETIRNGTRCGFVGKVPLRKLLSYMLELIDEEDKNV